MGFPLPSNVASRATSANLRTRDLSRNGRFGGPLVRCDRASKGAALAATAARDAILRRRAWVTATGAERHRGGASKRGADFWRAALAADPQPPLIETGVVRGSESRLVSASRELPQPSTRQGDLPLSTADAKQPCIVALGASTGGPAAIATILSQLPQDFRLPILVVLHMATLFAPSLVEWLERQSALKVCLAQDGDAVPLPGAAAPVILAPPGHHMIVEAGKLRLTNGPERHSCRPSADVLFESIALECGARTVAGVLTGMGRDGATGLLALRQLHAMTFAQDEATCAVFGMPQEAIRIGAAELVLPLDRIANTLVQASLSPGKRSKSRDLEGIRSKVRLLLVRNPARTNSSNQLETASAGGSHNSPSFRDSGAETSAKYRGIDQDRALAQSEPGPGARSATGRGDAQPESRRSISGQMAAVSIEPRRGSSGKLAVAAPVDQRRTSSGAMPVAGVAMGTAGVSSGRIPVAASVPEGLFGSSAASSAGASSNASARSQLRGTELFTQIVQATGLSELLARSTVESICRRLDVSPRDLSPEDVPRLVEGLERTLQLFLPPAEARARLSALHSLAQ